MVERRREVNNEMYKGAKRQKKTKTKAPSRSVSEGHGRISLVQQQRERRSKRVVKRGGLAVPKKTKGMVVITSVRMVNVVVLFVETESRERLRRLEGERSVTWESTERVPELAGWEGDEVGTLPLTERCRRGSYAAGDRHSYRRWGEGCREGSGR